MLIDWYFSCTSIFTMGCRAYIIPCRHYVFQFRSNFPRRWHSVGTHTGLTPRNYTFKSELLDLQIYRGQTLRWYGAVHNRIESGSLYFWGTEQVMWYEFSRCHLLGSLYQIWDSKLFFKEPYTNYKPNSEFHCVWGTKEKIMNPLVLLRNVQYIA